MANLELLDPEFHKTITEILIPNIELVSNLKWGVPQAKRTLAYQHELWKQGRLTPGPKVTNADAGSSAHNFGFAVDVCPYTKSGEFWWDAPEKYWDMLAEMVHGMGLVSGHFFKHLYDPAHVEDPKWKLAQVDWIKDGKPIIA